MKTRSALVTLFFLVSSLASAGQYGNYRIDSVPNREIDKQLPIGTAKTGTPANLRGLWWMDGNPLADKIISFARAKITDVKNRSGKITGHQMILPVYDEGMWSWDDSAKGRDLYGLVFEFRLTYKGQFDVDYTFGQVTPIINPLHGRIGVAIPPSKLVDFTMTKLKDKPNEWSRDSILNGKAYQYRLRRIVDENGKHTDDWDDFIKKVVEEGGLASSLIPICTLDDDGTYPTACAERDLVGYIVPKIPK